MANAESCPTRFSLLITVTFRVVGAMSCFGLIAVDRRAVDLAGGSHGITCQEEKHLGCASVFQSCPFSRPTGLS
jgi:hypothetical protein